MAGSLQIAAKPNQTTPNPSNTITNASATGGGVVSGDSAAVAVTITAKAEHKCPADLQDWFFTSGRNDRGWRGHTNPHKPYNNQSGSGRGNAGVEISKTMQQSAVIEVEMSQKIQQLSWTVVAAGDRRGTQQPTEYDENDNNERMRRAGGEG